MVATTQSDTTNNLRMGHQYRQYPRSVPSSVEGYGPYTAPYAMEDP